MKTLGRYSIGIGDRFGLAAEAQLAAVAALAREGVAATPVWNKSNREHNLIGTEPPSVRAAAERAVASLGWREPWFVDADHVSLKTVGRFLASSDFFTIDVADAIGKASSDADIQAFMIQLRALPSNMEREHATDPMSLDEATLASCARRYLAAILEAGRIYRHIELRLGSGKFITEVSMDEVSEPQTPQEIFVILAGLAWQGVPVQTIAPRFPGRFNKGVDYAGDLAVFERDFRRHLAAVRHARHVCNLPPDLKLSIHSGSDKYSIYPIVRRALEESGEGIHLKTAGTTWLEELAALAESSDDTEAISGANCEGLAIAREIYRQACAAREELCAPYAEVIDIDPNRLPAPDEVDKWKGATFAATLRHLGASDLADKRDTMNPDFRQLLHVAYPLAARMGARYTNALRAGYRATSENRFGAVGRRVTEHLLIHHLHPLFGGLPQ